MKTVLFPAIALLTLVVVLNGCNLEKEIDVPLPDYEEKLVVECYLEEGKPYRMALTESVSYFEGPRLPVVNDAEVTINHGASRIRLNYAVDVDTVYRKAYNYMSNSQASASKGEMYKLEVKDPKGRTVTASARFLPKVAIESVEWRFNKDDFAFLLVKFEDDPSLTNYYRFQIHKDSLNKRDFCGCMYYRH